MCSRWPLLEPAFPCTQVPNATVREISLEVECILNIRLEYSRLKGWQVSKAARSPVGGCGFRVLCCPVPFARLPSPLPKFNQGSKGVDFEVLSLNHIMKGSSMPLPQTLLKAVLNLVLPQVRGPHTLCLDSPLHPSEKPPVCSFPYAPRW